MVRPSFIAELYVDSHDAIKRDTATMSHGSSLWQPPFGGNCVNWLMGHLIVSRCSFLILLDVPSVWSMEQCRRFAPGSEPVTGESGLVSFALLLADFDRTQDRLLEALAQATADDLNVIKGKRTMAETFLLYHAHEANHASQIELLSQFSGQETGG